MSEYWLASLRPNCAQLYQHPPPKREKLTIRFDWLNHYKRWSSGSRTTAMALSSCCGEVMLRRKLPRLPREVKHLDSSIRVLRWMLRSIMCWRRPTQVLWAPTREDGGDASTFQSATSCWSSPAGRRLIGNICQIVELETLKFLTSVQRKEKNILW